MPTLLELFATGSEIGNKMARESRARFNARKEFGDAADNPVLFQQLENIEATQNNQRRQDTRLGLSQRADKRAQKTFDTNQKRQRDADTRANALRAVNALRSARDRGEDIGVAFDRLSPLLEDMGVDPADFPNMKQTIIDDSSSLDDFAAALTDRRTSGRSTAQEAKAESEAAELSVEQQTALVKLGDTLKRVERLADPSRAAAGRAVFGLPGVRKLGLGGFGAFGAVPSTPAGNFAADIEALSGDVRLQAFKTLKGGGQITETESEFAAQATANLSRDNQSFEQFQRELKDLRDFLSALDNAANQRAQGIDVPEITPNAPESVRAASGETTDPADVGGMTGFANIPVGTVVEEGGLGTFMGGDPTKLENWRPFDDTIPDSARPPRAE